MKNILPELRAQRGWTQGDLATKLAVSRQTVNAVETGRYEPSLSLAFAIAALFAQPIESIFQWKRQLSRFTGEPDTKSGEP
jgi:putative transcriptional regulator